MFGNLQERVFVHCMVLSVRGGWIGCGAVSQLALILVRDGVVAESLHDHDISKAADFKD